jgi:hypothetical protein
LYPIFIFLMCATCPTHLIFLDLRGSNNILC